MKNISNKLLREFGLIFGIGFPVTIGCLLPYLFGHALRFWTLWYRIVVVFLSIFFPKKLLVPYLFWMQLGNVLASINSRIIFGLVFFCVFLLPISFIMRMFGYDPLKKKFNNDISYREIKEKHKINFKKIF